MAKPFKVMRQIVVYGTVFHHSKKLNLEMRHY